MSTSGNKRRNTVPSNPSLDLVKTFSAMAYDLKVTHHPLVIDAKADLSAERFRSFLGKLDEMTSQMYTSMADERFRLHQLAALLVKFPFKDPSIDRKQAALGKFLRSEHKCRRMNTKFRLRRNRVEPPHMQFMRDYIASAIGNSIPFSQIANNCDFGPGSTVGVHGSDATFIRKLQNLTCTPTAVPVALACLAANTHYANLVSGGNVVCYDDFPLPGAISWRSGSELISAHLQLVQYNKITCVPKNAKTDRTIAIEPTLNGFIQKGVDVFLRKKLKRLGVDLSSQALNQSLARVGSRDGSYATIDLSAASDSISVQLVKELLPPAWFSFLDAIRSPSYSLDNETPVRYEKFCSMGNGFCFPLETLIFKAAVEYVMSVTAVAPQRCSAVYGDDIIVPYECALLLIEVLRDLGFKPNTDKTFVVGGFKESCGADYFFGVNVRPIYVKRVLRLNHEVYPLLNELSRRKMSETWQRVYDQLPAKFRYTRPYQRDDDTAIDVPMDVFMTSKHAKWNRLTHSWNWRKVVTYVKHGRFPADEREHYVGLLRGDLKHSDRFAYRFNDSTRVQVGT